MIILAFLLTSTVLGQGGGFSKETHDASPPASSSVSTHLVAFGDWGDFRHTDSLDRINLFLKDQSPQAVLLLGDNFNPHGIDPNLGLADPKFALFTDHLAANLSIPFISVLGHKDELRGTNSSKFQVEYSQINPYWIMPSSNFFLTVVETVCIWGINSNIIREVAEIQEIDAQIEHDLENYNCRWKVMISHLPMMTAGVYRTNADVRVFRKSLLPIVLKHSFDFVLSSHDHSAQAIQYPGNNSPAFIISGAAVSSTQRSIDGSSFPLPGGGRLVWGDDSGPNVVVSLNFRQDDAEINFVRIRDNGEYDTLFTANKNRPIPDHPDALSLGTILSRINEEED